VAHRYLSACPGATQLNTLSTLQFDEAVAIKLRPLRARSGPGFEAKLHYNNRDLMVKRLNNLSDLR